MKITGLKVGDTFINTQGNFTTVTNIHGSGTRCALRSVIGTEWHEDVITIINRVNTKVYSKFIPFQKKLLKPICVCIRKDRVDFNTYKEWCKENDIPFNKKWIGTSNFYGIFHGAPYTNNTPWLIGWTEIEDLILKTKKQVKTNEKTSKITSNEGRERTKAISKSIGTRKIAIASSLIGNSIPIGATRRQIRSIEIRKESISVGYY